MHGQDGKRTKWYVASGLLAGVVALVAWLPGEGVHVTAVTPVEVRVTGAAGVLMDEQTMSGSELRARLRQLHADDPQRSLIVRAEPGARFARVREVLRDVQQMGFVSVALESHGAAD